MEKNILFLCTGNSCRSQMAEGFGKALKGSKFNFFSAGTKKHGINQRAVKVMREVGVDISDHTSNLVEELNTDRFDYIITVCSHAHETCPYVAHSNVVHVWFDEISLGKPSREGDGTSCSRDPRLFPRECRESSATYKAPMSATLAWSFGEPDNVYRRKFRLCSFPVMIGSVACHLWGASSGDLIRRGEERYEAGGYFIPNGIERIIRLLIQQRQHYIMYGRIPSLRLHSCSRTALTYNKCFFALLNFHGNLFYPSFQGNGRLQLLSYLAEDSSKACHPTHILNVAPSCSSINLLVLRDLMKRE